MLSVLLYVLAGHNAIGNNNNCYYYKVKGLPVKPGWSSAVELLVLPLKVIQKIKRK